MTKRIVLGGLLGGVVMFLWGAAAHTFLNLYGTSVRPMPAAAEAAVVATLKDGLTSPGFYFVPGMDWKKAAPAEQEAWAEKYKAGPRAIVVYQPTGALPMGPPQLLRQLVNDIAVGLLAALLLATACPLLSRYSSRLMFVVLLGAVPWLALSLPYWNWYGFPSDFTLVTLLDTLLAFLFGGFVLAGVVKQT